MIFILNTYNSMYYNNFICKMLDAYLKKNYAMLL